METNKSNIDIAAKQLWHEIANFQDLLEKMRDDDDYAHLYREYLKISSELALFIDRNFSND